MEKLGLLARRGSTAPSLSPQAAFALPSSFLPFLPPIWEQDLVFSAQMFVFNKQEKKKPVGACACG